MDTLAVDRLVGQILGTYRVERLLGKGRLNAVYLARHLETKDSVAVTLYILPERFSPEARQRFMQRFRKEGPGLISLRHPHILPVHEYGEYQGFPYLVTPYMMNGSLADLLKREGRLGHEQVVDILGQVVAGLEYAHSKKVVHGTLKPANIVLNDRQEMLVAAFGLMHILQMRGIEQNNQPYSHLYSIADSFLAAPEYLAPEIVRGQSIDTRSDVYALGIILYELLSGNVPFKGGSPLEVANRHIEETIPPLRKQYPDIPIAIASVVNQALEREPAERFQSASELAEAFMQASLGAAKTPALHTDQLQSVKSDHQPTTSTLIRSTSRLGSSGSWQFKPPIMTNQMEIAPASEETKRPQKPVNQVHSSARSTGNTDSWQLLPPVVTGQMPAIEPSPPARKPKPVPIDTGREKAAPPVRRESSMPVPVPPQPSQSRPARSTRSNGMSLPGEGVSTDQPGAWWTQAQQPVETQPQEQRPQDATLIQASNVPAWQGQVAGGEFGYNGGFLEPDESMLQRKSGSQRRRGRKTGRRNVIALLAAGGVVAASAVVVTNSHLLSMVSNSIHMTSAAPASNTHTATPASAPANAAKGKKQAAANQTQHTGTVVGSSMQAPNTAVAFTNPADKKASLLIKSPTGNFSALERACTHEQVNVNYDPATGKLVCPLHGSIFNATTGAVVQGPAQLPLPKVAIHVNSDGMITV